MEVRVPYGSGTLTLDVARETLLGIYRPSDVPVTSPVATQVTTALRHPLGGLGLDRLVTPGSRVAIAVDDNTRVTPVHALLPPLLAALERRGVVRRAVTIIAALGSHRLMAPRELRAKYGAELVEAHTVVNHEWTDPSQLLPQGKLPGRIPIEINRRFLEADVRIGVSNVIPHFTAGWSGGSKILLPGLAGEGTVAGMHWHGARTMPNALGVVDNPPRRLMDGFAARVGLHLSVNTVLTRGGEVAGVYAGECRAAHRAAVAHADRLYAVPIPARADVTVVSSFPADLDFWQAEKGLYTAALSTRSGGGILLITPCPEGISASHRAWAELLAYEARDLEEMIARGDVDDVTAASLALCVAKTRDPFTVCLCSDGISEQEAEQLHFTKFDAPTEALRHLQRTVGRTTLVLPHGGDTLPRPAAPRAGQR